MRLLTVGERPHLVAMTLRPATGLVDALRASGARAHLLVRGTGVGMT